MRQKTWMKTSYPILDPRVGATKARRDGRKKCALAVMIKAPRAGRSKTRLVPPLTHAEAAQLSAGFLRDTADNIASACAVYSEAGRKVDAVAAYTPRGAEGALAELLPHEFALLPQRGASFGERLFHAAADLLRVGYESCCLIDSDSPTLPRARLSAAVAELRRPGDRLVLGPADDGGYYLIGLKRAHPRLFEEIAWSTADVLTRTIERARETALEVKLLPAWYDVDDASTLRRLYDELFDGHGGDDATGANHASCHAAYHAPHTRAELARLFDAEGLARLLNSSRGARARGEGGG
jgi:rSAM/selenodomain-associated transferase 1